MPYKTKSDLPESVKHVLPSHAQDIYKEAFNSAWDQYKDKEDRCRFNLSMQHPFQLSLSVF